MIAIAGGSAYIERTALYSPKSVRQTKKALTKAFKVQMEGLGFSLVEVLSPCPTNWKMTPVEATKCVRDEMTKTFPIKVIKDEVGKI
jgi:2-oxoglutarate ferredoxin oxidoreductase subunit beta